MIACLLAKAFLMSEMNACRRNDDNETTASKYLFRG
jgi:hypothetical protein